MTCAIIFGLSLIILVVFTITVYLPLRKIAAGANEYAAGNLNYRIKVKTHDEMGYLSNTLNYMSKIASRYPLMEVSGERKSWETLAMKLRWYSSILLSSSDI